MMPICEAGIRNQCPRPALCESFHVPTPYLWQLHLDNTWVTLEYGNCTIEEAYCDPSKDIFQIQV